mgnify:CR=1 FL=1
MPAQLGVGLVLVGVDGSEDFSGIKQMGLVEVLANVVRNDGHVQQEREPVTGEQEEHGDKGLQSSLGSQELKKKKKVNKSPKMLFFKKKKKSALFKNQKKA